jgi:RNA polymerase sigma-70 factor (ECF subfamily)
MNAEITQIIGALKSANGAVRAFDLVIERYGERLYWHARRIVVQHEEAEDVVQDTFVTAYSSIGSFRGETEGSLLAWLYRIATTQALKAIKRRKRHIFTSIDSLSSTLIADFEGEIAPDADEITVRLQKAILALPMKQKLVFNLRYFDQLPFEDISQITGQSVSALKTNYHYAARRVKQIVSQLDFE